MPYNQGDLINLNKQVKMPDGTLLYHPVLIINSKRSGYETFYTGVMMTASTNKDRYSFPCDDSMFITPLKKTGCQFRLYLVFGFLEEDIKELVSQMKKVYYSAVISQIKEHILNID